MSLRRSTRQSSTISRFSNISVSDKWPLTQPITRRCWQIHSGLGCGAKNAKHMPLYYDSLSRVCLNNVKIF